MTKLSGWLRHWIGAVVLEFLSSKEEIRFPRKVHSIY